MFLTTISALKPGYIALIGLIQAPFRIPFTLCRVPVHRSAPKVFTLEPEQLRSGAKSYPVWCEHGLKLQLLVGLVLN